MVDRRLFDWLEKIETIVSFATFSAIYLLLKFVLFCV